MKIRRLNRVTVPPKKKLLADFQLFCETLRVMDAVHKKSPYPDDMHRYMHAMQESERLGISDVFIEMYRGIGKTSILTAPYIAWRLAKDHSLRVLVLSQSREYSENMTRAILYIIEEKLPHLYRKKSKKKYTSKLFLKHDRPYKEPSVMSASIFSSLSSIRSDLIICDDICTLENADTPTKLQNVLRKFEGLPFLFGENFPQLFVIGTPGRYGDLNHKIINNVYGKHWAKFFRPALRKGAPEIEDMPEPPISVEDARELYKWVWWKKNLPFEKFLKAYNTGMNFMSQFLLIPPMSSAVRFDARGLVIKKEAAPNVKFSDVMGLARHRKFKTLILSVDPSLGMGGDDTAIVVVALDNTDTWHVLDGWGSNMANLSAITKAWHLLAQKWSVNGAFYPDTYVESVGTQGWLAGSIKEKDAKFDVRLVSPSHKMKKEQRIEAMLSPIITNRRLVIWNSAISDKLIHQITEYGSTDNDDYPDALSQAVATSWHLDEKLAPGYRIVMQTNQEAYEEALAAGIN